MCAYNWGSRIRGSVAEEVSGGECFDALDASRNEDGGLAGRKRDGDLDDGVLVVATAAAKTKAALRNVVALDEFVGCVEANAGSESDTSANVAATIGLSTSGKCGK
jgi:hypothetical protein